MIKTHHIQSSHDGKNLQHFIKQQDKLDLDYLFITEKICSLDTYLLLKIINDYASLKILMIYNINIGINGIILFSNALERNYTLTSLSLTGNIGDAGIRELGQALSKNQRLSLFAIQDKTITHPGANVFSNLIKNNTTLRYISFGENYNIEKNVHDSLKSIVNRNIIVWKNTYWTPYLHKDFNCHKMVMTTLLCNDEYNDNGFKMKLPMLVWTQIFSFWLRI
jgi:hypothetical protein